MGVRFQLTRWMGGFAVERHVCSRVVYKGTRSLSVKVTGAIRFRLQLTKSTRVIEV